MLKPKDLKNHSFTPQGRNAYKASEVDEYMDEVFRSYERMYHENSEMLNRMKLLTDRLTTTGTRRTTSATPSWTPSV